MAAFQSAGFPQADGGIDAQVEDEPPWGFVVSIGSLRRFRPTWRVISAVTISIKLL